MKKVISHVQKRLKEEATQIALLEHNINMYKCIFEDNINMDMIGKCYKCTRMVHLDYSVAGSQCLVVCLDCKPKKCKICDLYHVEEGVQALKEKEARKRKKKRKITLG